MTTEVSLYDNRGIIVYDNRGIHCMITEVSLYVNRGIIVTREDYFQLFNRFQLFSSEN